MQRIALARRLEPDATDRLRAGERRGVCVLAVALLAGAVAAVVAVVAAGAPTSLSSHLAALGVLVAVAVVAQHRDVFFHFEAGVEAGSAVVVASVLLLGRGNLGGPVVVGVVSGVAFLPHLRARAWLRIAYNAGNFGLAALAAAGAAAAVPVHPSSGAGAAMLVSAVAGLAYWLVNDSLLFLLFALRDHHLDPTVVGRVTVENAILFPLTLVGGLAALLYDHPGWWAGVVVLAAATFAPELLLVRLPRHLVEARARARRRAQERAHAADLAVAAIAAELAASLGDALPPELVDDVLAAAEHLHSAR
jgi:hypothetical protein